MRSAHQIATRAVGGQISIATIRDTSDGTVRFAVSYDSRGDRWLSNYRFEEIDQAHVGALVLSDFLGCEYRE